ncbi:hypothetical protein EBU24_04490 [bacterium]|nr:hypothetical protein [bacterium]
MFTKNNSNLISVFIGLIVGVGGFYFYMQRFNQVSVANDKTYKVAVLIPAVHPSMDQIENGFADTLKKVIPAVKVDIFNASGNKVLMKGLAQEIVEKNYDIAFAVGTGASQMLKASIDKFYTDNGSNNKRLPLVFAAVSDPVAAGLVDENKMVTGVIDQYDFNDQIELLMLLKKVKKPLLVYDSNSNQAFEKQVKDIEKVFASYDAHLTVVPVSHINEVYQKVSGVINGHDLIMTLTDHTICSAMDSLVKLCSTHGITLFTSELDSNAKGAALSYGVNERDYGVQAAEQVLESLVDRKEIAEIPVRIISPFYIKINKATASLQGLNISKEQFNLYEKVQVQKGN